MNVSWVVDSISNFFIYIYIYRYNRLNDLENARDAR